MAERFGLIGSCLVVPVLLSACATAPTTGGQSKLDKTYTAQERIQMTYCVGMADTAKSIADRKLRNASIDEVKSHYVGKAQEKLTLATVDKVYAESFTSSWEYAVSFFDECAANMASVEASRVGMASYCHMNALIAGTAHDYKVVGAPKESAYSHFKGFNSETPREIVDQVYSSSKSRVDLKLDAWSQCMKHVSAK